MASIEMVKAAEQVIEAGGNVEDALDAALRAHLEHWPAMVADGRLVTRDQLLPFFEVSEPKREEPR